MAPIAHRQQNAHKTHKNHGGDVFGHDSDWWNSTLILSLGIAALAAFLVVAATAAVIIAQRREAVAAKEDFERLRTEAAQANEGAALANQRAAQALKQAADLGVTVENLTKVAEDKTAQANLAIAALQQATAEASVAVGKLSKNQTPRALSPKQRADLIKVARHLIGQKFTITSLMGDSEGRDFTMELVGVLEEAGWGHDGPDGIRRAVRTDNPIGVQVEMGMADIDAGRIPPALNEFIDQLVADGFMGEATLVRLTDPSWQPQTGYLSIVVGTKPLEKLAK